MFSFFDYFQETFIPNEVIRTCLYFTVLINFASLGMEVLLQWTPRKLLDSILFQKNSPLHLFLKRPLFLRHCSASFQKCPLLWYTNIWFATGPDVASTYNKIRVCLLCDYWRNSAWYWNLRIVSVVEYLHVLNKFASSSLFLVHMKFVNYIRRRVSRLSTNVWNYRIPLSFPAIIKLVNVPPSFQTWSSLLITCSGCLR